MSAYTLLKVNSRTIDNLGIHVNYEAFVYQLAKV